MSKDLPLSRWNDHIGRMEQRTDIANTGVADRVAALLDHDTPPWRAGTLPPLGHWMHFLPAGRQSLLDADGHLKRGAFMPPIDLPREMWAGTRVDFIRDIPIGAQMTQETSISSIVEKNGRQGRLVFITINNDVICDGMKSVVERQQIVYREEERRDGKNFEPPKPGPVTPMTFQRDITPDPPMLFRFSALTFNSHRIHYDLRHASDREGYPDLVVHGPLTALLLTDLMIRSQPNGRLTQIEFRAKAPAFCGRAMQLGAEKISQTGADQHWQLAAHDDMGRLVMDAKADLQLD